MLEKLILNFHFRKNRKFFEADNSCDLCGPCNVCVLFCCDILVICDICIFYKMIIETIKTTHSKYIYIHMITAHIPHA